MKILIVAAALFAVSGVRAEDLKCEPEWTGKTVVVKTVSTKKMILCGEPSQKGKGEPYRFFGFKLLVDDAKHSKERTTLAGASELDEHTVLPIKNGFRIGSWVQPPGRRSAMIFEFDAVCGEKDCHLTKKRCRFPVGKNSYPKAVSDVKALEKIVSPEFKKPVWPDSDLSMRLAFAALSGDSTAISEFDTIPSRFFLDGAGAEEFDRAKDFLREAREAGCGKR